jgi:surface antigen
MRMQNPSIREWPERARRAAAEEWQILPVFSGANAGGTRFRDARRLSKLVSVIRSPDAMRGLHIAAAVLLLLTVGVDAQINPFGRYSSDRLSERDKHLAEEASARIYTSQSPAIGKSEAWANPETGHKGTVTLVNLREREGLPCRTLRYTIAFEPAAQPVEFVLDRCRTGTGEWKLL